MTDQVSGYLNWCVWRKIGGGVGSGKPNGSYSDHSTKGNKIVLIQSSSPVPQSDPGSWYRPTHFSIDMSPKGLIYQHVDYRGPAYRLGHGPWPSSPWGYRSDNRDGGRTIQVQLCNVPSSYTEETYKYFWTWNRWFQLLWFLDRLCNKFNVEKRVQFDWDYPNLDYPPSTLYDNVSGIVGWRHCPMSSTRNPGYIVNRDWFNEQLKSGKFSGGQAPQGYDGVNVYLSAERENGTNYYQDPNNPDNQVEESDESGDERPIVIDTPMDDKDFRFNPSLHSFSIPKRVDFTEGSVTLDRAGLNQEYQDYFDDRNLPSSFKDADLLKNLRLGRIIQHETAAGGAALNEYRYGFRFLYNPTKVTLAASRNTSVVLDPRSTMNAVISGINQNFQTISFQLFLNRQPDVVDPRRPDSYDPPISEEEWDELRKYGTHWDLEYLYRVCNGLFDLKDRGRTADIGIIVPSNARLLLGNENWFGFVESVSYEDTHFSENMVPILTTVDITFRRHVDISPDDFESWTERLGSVYAGSAPSDETDDGSSDTADPTGANSGTKINGSTLMDLLKGVGFSGNNLKIAMRVAYAESGWDPTAFNGDSSTCDRSYGLFQINMIEGVQGCDQLGPGRRQEYGISVNEELLSAQKNVEAAYKIWRNAGGRFTPWSVFNNNKYRQVTLPGTWEKWTQV